MGFERPKTPGQLQEEENYKKSFENKSHVEDGYAVSGGEKRSNLEAIEKQRNKYVREAIQEVKKTTPKDKFNESNIGDLRDSVSSILLGKDNLATEGLSLIAFAGSEKGDEDTHPANRKAVNAAYEHMGAYPDEVIEKLLREAFEQK